MSGTGPKIMPMDAFPYEQAELTTRELELIDVLSTAFQTSDEHVLDPALMLYICR